MLDESAFRQSSLCIVGNLNRDVKAAPLRPWKGLFQDGETSVSYVAETIGGGGAISAFTAASLGARVAFLGKVGGDGLGSRLERTLTRHGISSHLARDKAYPSGTSITLSFENGHRHFISCLPASRALTFADLDLQALAAHQHLLRADIWFSEAMLREGNGQLFRAARQAGLDVSIDLNWDPHWGHAPANEIQARKKLVRAVLPSVNLVHGNVRELTEFAQAPDLETALQRLVEWGAEAVVVHLGEEGAGYYHQGTWIKEPPAPVHAQVNTTGTGDVLSVCMMLLHRCDQASIPERLRLANLVVAQFMEGKRHFIPPLAD
jgi:sugar/nucleoside kinase (ribokinase family)